MWIACSHLSSDTLERVALYHGKNLTNLHLNENTHLTDNGLLIIIKSCLLITHLDIQGCTNITNCSIKQIPLYLENVNHLNLSETKITAGFDIECAKLNYLNLTFCRFLTDGGIALITSQCPNLTTLKLVHCNNVTSDGLKTISTNCKLLEHLDVSGTHFYDSIQEKCQNLRLFYAKRCTDLSDEGIRLITENCPQLEDLDLSYCDGITDTALKLISWNCRKLLRLNLKWCKNITRDGINNIESTCKNLEQLDLSGMNRQFFGQFNEPWNMNVNMGHQI